MCSTGFGAQSREKSPWQRLRQPCCFRKSKFRNDVEEPSVRQFWRRRNLAAPQRRILNPKWRSASDEDNRKASPAALKLRNINGGPSSVVRTPRRSAAEDRENGRRGRSQRECWSRCEGGRCCLRSCNSSHARGTRAFERAREDGERVGALLHRVPALGFGRVHGRSGVWRAAPEPARARTQRAGGSARGR